MTGLGKGRAGHRLGTDWAWARAGTGHGLGMGTDTGKTGHGLGTVTGETGHELGTNWARDWARAGWARADCVRTSQVPTSNTYITCIGLCGTFFAFLKILKHNLTCTPLGLKPWTFMRSQGPKMGYFSEALPLESTLAHSPSTTSVKRLSVGKCGKLLDNSFHGVLGKVCPPNVNC